MALSWLSSGAGIGLFGLNLGVDFVGGTLIEVKFAEPIDAEAVRMAAMKGGLHEPAVQGVGSAEEATFLLRVGGTTQLTEQAALHATQYLRARADIAHVSRPDLESGVISFRASAALDQAALKDALERATGVQLKEVHLTGAASQGGFDYQLVSQGMAVKVQAALTEGTGGKTFEVRRVEYVGPQVGKQLRNRGVLAVLFAAIATMLYVALRFDFKFMPGVAVGLVHDIVMVLGYYVLTQREFNLTGIAVLLTALGYSLNDRIVVYDRIREEMGRFKGKPMAEIINIAVNATLSRTILTSGVTALSLVGLLVFGVGEIFDFAAAMLVGIVVGTYSSIYIASPLTIWMDERQSHQAPPRQGAPSQGSAS